MERFNKGNIFLLELVVDYVHLDYSENDDCFMNSETCVTFGFLNNGPIYVRENEFCSNSSTSDNDYIKHGKSCLFSLSPAKMAETLNDFDVNIGVYKIMSPNLQPEMVLAGSTVIPLVHLYQELMGEMYAKNCSGVISKNLDGCFDLVNNKYQSTGRINLFLRITCYGKVLVSNIKMNVQGDNVENTDEDHVKYVAAAEPNALNYTRQSHPMYAHNSSTSPTERSGSRMYSRISQSCSPVQYSEYKRTSENHVGAYNQWTDHSNYLQSNFERYQDQNDYPR